MFKNLVAVLVAAGLLAGCASDANRQALATAQLDCAGGDSDACRAIPVQEQINHDEAVSNGLKAAAIGILLPLAILAAAAENDQPPAQCWSYRWHRWYYC